MFVILTKAQRIIFVVQTQNVTVMNDMLLGIGRQLNMAVAEHRLIRVRLNQDASFEKIEPPVIGRDRQAIREIGSINDRPGQILLILHPAAFEIPIEVTIAGAHHMMNQIRVLSAVIGLPSAAGPNILIPQKSDLTGR